jgi:hypothetical protein
MAIMQKKIKRESSNSLSQNTSIAPESTVSPEAVSNDNHVQASEKKVSISPKVLVSPKKSSSATRFGKKVAGSNPPALHTFKERQTPILSSSSDTQNTKVETPDSRSQADSFENTQAKATKPSPVFFDVKFALSLIAIVVGVNLLLAILVDQDGGHTASAKKQELVSKTSAPEAQSKPAQGSVVHDAANDPLDILSPSAGNGMVTTVDTHASPSQTTQTEPVALAPQKHQDLGVMANDADVKKPPRDLMTIIGQY